jgi:outer membrane lipoprotein-sorting protein
MRTATKLAALTLAGISTLAHAQQSSNVDAVLHQLDVSSATFKSAQANLRIDLFERVVKDTTTECGLIVYERQGAAIQMDSKSSSVSTNTCPATISPNDPASRIIEYKGGQLQMFEPLANHLTVINANNNQAQVESFFTLGFGASGPDQGTETINDGSKDIQAVKLQLIAKDPGILKSLTRVLIWVDPARGVSLKQQFFTPAGDYRTTYFTNIRYNQKVDTNAFAIKTNSKTVKDVH